MTIDANQQSGRSTAIGGYFELDLPRGNGELYPDALKFQSARAAFTSLLLHLKPKRIWMPWYNCGTLLEGPEAAEVEVIRYAIDADLYPAGLEGFGPSDCLLYVNYFGVCGQQVARLLDDMPRNQIVVDHSHAFYAPPPACLATIYSPRKFFGVPDGGLLATQLSIQAPAVRDDRSIDRMKPLLIRFAEGPEAGYLESKKARLSLQRQPVRTMSTLTQAMLRSIDYPGALARRNANFSVLDRALGRVNRLPITPGLPAGPLCYPFFSGADRLHQWLIDHRVFVAHYWPEVRGPSGTESDLESILVRQCVPLPCDQRYGAADMDRVIALVTAYLEAHEHP